MEFDEFIYDVLVVYGTYRYFFLEFLKGVGLADLDIYTCS